MITEIENLPEISFTDDMSLPEVESQMVHDYQEKYLELTGETTSLVRGEPISLILYACAVQLFQMYLYIEKAGKENLLKYAEGDALDNLAALKGITRTAATTATVTMKFTLSAPQSGVVAIPKGTRVTDGSVYFATNAYAEILAGDTEVEVACSALEAGEDSNGIMTGAIDSLVDPIPYVASVTNTDESAGGADTESDESLRDRIFIAPSRNSTCGTKESYQYWVETYSQNISDVLITSSTPGEVDISFLVNGEIPKEADVKGLQSYIEDPEIKPLSDKVVVSAPTAQDYTISLTYYINRSDSDKVQTIQSAVESAVSDYVDWQHAKIGRDINPSELIKRVTAAGAKRVEIASPAFTKVPETGVANLASKTLTYGGVEDD